MKGQFKSAPPETADVYMRRVGYARHVSHSGEVSYVRRLTGYEFPRMHVYVDTAATPHIISIHLDQKQHTYDGFAAHSGEYDGEGVREELARIAAHIGIPVQLFR